MSNPSDSATLRNISLFQRISEIKVEPLFWGYRSVWAYLRYLDGLLVNKKGAYWLIKEHNLTVKPNPRLIAMRASEKPKPQPDKPKEWRGIDMT